MTRLLPLLAILCLCSFSPFVQHIEPATFVEREPTWTIYEVSEAVTGAPAWIIEGLHFAESSKGRNYKHPDPFDVGDFGWHETEAIHKERVRLFGGEYDINDPRQMAIKTGQLYQHNLKIVKDKTMAIAAHHQGPTGVIRDGIDYDYVNKVIKGGLSNG